MVCDNITYITLKTGPAAGCNNTSFLWKKKKYLEQLLASEKYCAVCTWPETP